MLWSSEEDPVATPPRSTAPPPVLNVALVERDKVGGTCLHRGCVPAKEFLETAHVRRTVEHAGDFGITTDGRRRSTSPSARQRKNDDRRPPLQGPFGPA